MSYLNSKVQFKINSTTPILDGLIEFIREYGQEDRSLHIDIDSGSKKLPPYLAESFYNTISSHHKFKHLQRGRQEDAEEFLGYLLDALDDELREAVESSSSASKEPDPSQWIEVGKHSRHIQSRHSGNTRAETPIGRIFGGRFKSVLSSPTQKSSSVTYDPFQHVQLDISEPHVDSIQDALDCLFHPEIIPYKTGKGFQVSATKQVCVDRVPKVLIVHLKRFSFTFSGEITKITKSIELTRDLSLSSPSALTHYKLFSVVYHHGPSATAGHYTVDLYSEDRWTGIDDIVILDGTKDGPPLESKTAYLLFYIRV
jgi:ubiquitin carboxyl-terminal hydrolase 10